jgi:aldose 1-epimerase
LTELLTLSSGPVVLVLAPSMGGAVARLDVSGRPVLRPWNGDTDNPFSLASNVLVPFSNRISSGGLNWDGEYHPIGANLRDEAYPIHGDGFQKPWTIENVSPHSARLVLYAGNIGPFHYCAEQIFHLTQTGLRIELTLTNTGTQALPFGCGFHPWFPRNAATKLSFAAKGVWMEDDDHLPTNHLSLDDAPDWDFLSTRSLPNGLLNNGYTDWRGLTQIEQGVDYVSVHITASENLSTAIVYSPNAKADFFCFEPVSHPVDAFNLSGHPGLMPLTPSQSMQTWMEISWSSK